MRRKLTIGAITIAIIIVSIIAGNQIIISLFGNFSKKLITEYHELHALQEFKISLSKSLIYLNIDDQLFWNSADNEFSLALEESLRKFHECNKVLSHVHKQKLWLEIEIQMLNLEKSSVTDGTIESLSDPILRSEISIVGSEVINDIEFLVSETMEEIEEYEVRNRKVILHGTSTVVAFGALLILFLIFGGIGLIRRLTKPIRQLVEATEKIGMGDLELRVKVDSDDEFLLLASSFNEMLDDLKKSSISEEFHKNILNNLYGALLVTDTYCKIKSINRTTSSLLNYSEKELIGQNVSILFDENFQIPSLEPHDCQSLESLAKTLAKASEIRAKDERSIPVYVTCTILRDKKGEAEGMVVVCHDLTEERANEDRIERIRKEGVIAINEAQENERIRIATDIHDGLGQMLAGISYSIQDLTSGWEEKADTLNNLQKQVDSTIQEARNIAQDLTPILLKDFGLEAAIQNLVNKITEHNEINLVFNTYDFEERIDPKLEKALYRICQEGLNNILKHSQAANASIELFKKEEYLVLVIDDDGKGFKIDDDRRGFKDVGIGLISIRERVYAFDGILTIESQEGRGTELMIEIPCKRKIL